MVGGYNMGYPYSWNKIENAGIKGPAPQSIDLNKTKREFDLYGRSDEESFYAGFTELDYKSLIRASIQRILMTSKGERVMQPNFGNDLRPFVFEQINDTTRMDIKLILMNDLSMFEPRITIKDIKFSSNENILNIIIPYEIKGTGIEDQINYIIKGKEKSG
jgi:phage baseplate assembly protein W